MAAVAARLAQAACTAPAEPASLRVEMDRAGLHDAQALHCRARGPTPADAAAALAPCVERRRTALGATVVQTAVARAPGDGAEACAVAVLVRHLVRLDGVPAEATPFATLPLSAALEAEARAPEWLLMDPHGRVESLPRLPAPPGTSRTEARLHGGPGRYVVQVLVQGPGGPEVAAQAVIPAGPAPAPARLAVPEPARDDEAADALYAAVRLHRSRQDLPATLRNAWLEQAAAARLEQLQPGGTLRHVDPAGRDIAAAYAALGRVPPMARLAEVLGAGPTLEDVVSALRDSPGHRRYLDDPALTDLGLAALRSPGTGEWTVVLALGRPVEAPEGSVAQAEVLSRLNAERARRGLKPLALEPRLEALAGTHADQLARERRLVDLTPEGQTLADAALERSGGRRVGVQLYRVTRPDEVTASPVILDERYRRAAVGVRAGSGIDGLYVVVILLQP